MTKFFQAQPKSGSRYNNYKKTNSVVFLAISNAKCQFILTDVGAEGRRSDGGVFEESKMGQKFIRNEMSLPEPEKIGENGPTIPYFLVEDEAFALSSFMMRPYPRISAIKEEYKVFNYRLSRCRRIVECSFGIFTSRFRVFRKPIIAGIKKIILIINAAICIHNFILQEEQSDDFSSSNVRNIQQQKTSEHIFKEKITSTRASPKKAIYIRNMLASYFIQEGEVDWQWEKVANRKY